MRLYDITTETEDFIANGVVSHNCYARPSHAYLELSPGLDFEPKRFAKTNAAELLRAELSKPGYAPSPIAIGANTDCYQPIERKFRITRQIVEILAECEHPFTLVTKSALVERDLDLLAPMAKKNLVKVFVSIASLDRALARKLEPRAASPQRRMDVLRNLAQAGVPCGVMAAASVSTGTAPGASRRASTAAASARPALQARCRSFDEGRAAGDRLGMGGGDRLAFPHPGAADARLRARRQAGPFSCLRRADVPVLHDLPKVERPTSPRCGIRADGRWTGVHPGMARLPHLRPARHARQHDRRRAGLGGRDAH